MTPAAFAEIYPRLYHMTASGGWTGIERDGLLSVSRLVERHGADARTREALVLSRRPDQVALADGVTIRDNKVLQEGPLARSLRDGLTPRDWYEILNARVFFWVNPKRLERLLAGRAYRGCPHDVLTFETEALLSAHAERAEVTPLNTGAAFMRAAPRGRDSFVPLARTPFEEWRARRGRKDAVVEVAVREGVEDAGRYLLSVTRRQAGEPDETLWQR